MNNIEIYVKTSALGKTGIHWRKIETQEHQPVEKPRLIQHQLIKGSNKQITIVNDLIDEVKPSLLLFRDKEDNKLLLEVTGIESPQRSEKLGRRVLNSIVWIAEDLEENEAVIKKIAYSAIQSFLNKDLTFSKMIEESIEFFELEEFRVDLDVINQFIEDIKQANYQVINTDESKDRYQIERTSAEALEKLAEEIVNKPLPKNWIAWDGSTKTDGVLVVVTKNLERRTILHSAGVWRGFASNVQEPIKEVKEVVQLPEKKKETIPSHPPTVGENYSPKKQKTRLMMILLTVAIALALIVVSFKMIFQPQQIQQPQIQQQQILQP
ncbi:hypothetical protein [Rivularia sp. UHCC 0363]|uniref:hypothetical protein n=1 Tax=Rivularia sp. UHCC 0363 TaxID=3110244 RepID=UPI002B215C6C|nr:hypothetical protein [Rivularia sp. UHCC 0363]MEA5594635.1 hypothetical protein [Rivularia sp. UHCC 0363]